MSAVNRALSKSLRIQNSFPASRPAVRSASLLSGASSKAPGLSRNLSRATTTVPRPSTSQFHTMASLQSASAAPVKPAEGTGYDPEIKDIANYIHNYPIDSDLAVSLRPSSCPSPLLPRNRG